KPKSPEKVAIADKPSLPETLPTEIIEKIKPVATIEAEVTEPLDVSKPSPIPKSPADVDETKLPKVVPSKEPSRGPSPVEAKAPERIAPSPPKSPVEKPAEKAKEASPLISPIDVEEIKAESPEPTVAEKLPTMDVTPEETVVPDAIEKAVDVSKRPAEAAIPESPKEIVETKPPVAKSPVTEDVKSKSPVTTAKDIAEPEQLSPLKVTEVVEITERVLPPLEKVEEHVPSE
ncbi:hypothetical protein Trydic_g14906, partial [Trypoxylus dichotomus]